MSRNKYTLLLALLACMFITGFASAETEIFKLKDGVTIRCDVLYVTADTITVNQYLSQTGTEKKEATIQWSAILDDNSTLLKKKYGVPNPANIGDARFKRMGKRFFLVGARSPYEGFVFEEENTPRLIFLYTQGGKCLPIPRDSIEKTEDIEVDLRECLPSQRLYEIELDSNFPISSTDHYKLAKYCEAIGAIKKAIVHYKKAVDGDVRYGVIIGTTAEDLSAKYRETYAAQLLEQAIASYDRKNYRDAASKLASLIEYYPDTTSAKSAQELSLKVQEQLDLVIAKLIVDEYYKLISIKLRKRISGDVLDGQSKPGFRITLTSGGVVEGEFTDENGNPATPPAQEKAEATDDFETEDMQASDSYYYIKDKRSIIIEIPKGMIKEMLPVELNKKTKKATFSGDHRPYLNGKDNEMNREIRQELSLKYGVAERDLKEIWENRAVERRDIRGKVLRENLSRKQTINYGKGTFFSPKLARENKLVPKFPAAIPDQDEYFDSLSSSDKFSVLQGIYAEGCMIIEEDSVKIRECSKCKGTGKGEKEEVKPPAGTGTDDRQPRAGITRQLGCDACHGIGSFLTFTFK